MFQIAAYEVVWGYRILIVMPTPYKSHSIIGASIANELSKVGHNVTIISPFELKVDNVRDIVLTHHDRGNEKFTKKLKKNL